MQIGPFSPKCIRRIDDGGSRGDIINIISNEKDSS